MPTSKKIETIYHNGQPDEIRSIRKTLSTMTTYLIPRSLLSDAKKIKGINNPGIYYLINEDENNKIAQIYIGQTRNGIERLDDHNRKKDFWNKAIMFLGDQKTFTLDTISGLEEYAIEKANASKRYKVENTIQPSYQIDEYDLPSIEEVYEEIEFIMATLGYSMVNAVENSGEQLVTSKNGIVGLAKYSGEDFVVLEGSQIDLSRKALSDKIECQRRKMLKENQISEENGKYYLDISVSFSSPSAGAAFVLGGSQNGWIEWKDSNGKTIDEIIRKGEK